MRILEFYKDEENFYIVSEYCAGGDLFERLKETAFTEKEVAAVMHDVLTGISYLHKNGIVHRYFLFENI